MQDVRHVIASGNTVTGSGNSVKRIASMRKIYGADDLHLRVIVWQLPDRVAALQISKKSLVWLPANEKPDTSRHAPSGLDADPGRCDTFEAARRMGMDLLQGYAVARPESMALVAWLRHSRAMELYHNDMSTCAQKVRMVLHEKNLAPTLHHINLRTGEQNTPAYRKLNPNAVVPTLVDHGQVIIESTVICEYLDDAYPTPALRPTDPLERARMRWWTTQPDAGLHQAVGITCMAVAFRHQMLAKGPKLVEQLIAARTDPVARERFRGLLELGVGAPEVPAAVRRYDQFVAQMAEQLGRTPWLAGSSFSLADIMAVPYIVRLEHLSYDWWWTDAARGRQAVGEWLKRCKARPSYGAITDYLDAGYLELLPRVGREVQPAIEAILKPATG